MKKTVSLLGSKISIVFPNSLLGFLPVSLTYLLPWSSSLTLCAQMALRVALPKYSRLLTSSSISLPGMLLSHESPPPHSLPPSPCSNVTIPQGLRQGPSNTVLSHLRLVIPYLLVWLTFLQNICQKWKYICMYLLDYFLSPLLEQKLLKHYSKIYFVLLTLPSLTPWMESGHRNTYN